MRYKTGDILFTATLVPKTGRYEPRECRVISSEFDPMVECRLYTVIIGHGVNREKTWRYEEELFRIFNNALKDCDVKNLDVLGSLSKFKDMKYEN